MKLNGIACDGWRAVGTDGAEFSLSGTTVEEAASAVSDSMLLTDDDGKRLVASFAGHRAVSVSEVGDGTVRLRTARVLDAPLEDHIRAIEDNVRAAVQRADESAELAAAAEQKVDSAVDTVQTYEIRLSGAETAATGATDAVNFMSQTALPQLISASSMYVNAVPVDNVQLASVINLIDEFVPGKAYAKGVVKKYDEQFYRMAQDISEQTSKTYQPGPGTESLYTLIDIADDGIRVWHAPTDATNAFALGEKCHYPDADGPVYVSKRDGNTSEPTTDEWWDLDTGQDVTEGQTEPEQGTEEVGSGDDEEHADPETSYPEFVQPTGAHDSYAKGDRVTFEGKVYESTIDNNAYSPSAYPQGWQLVE